jgi:signal transduction histidine kinase
MSVSLPPHGPQGRERRPPFTPINRGLMRHAPASDIRWWWVATAGLLVALLTPLLVGPAIAVYSLIYVVISAVLPIGGRGSTDSATATAWVVPAVTLVLTVTVAALLARRVRARPVAHGVLLGVVVAVGSLIDALVTRGHLQPQDLAGTLAIGAGWLGGRLGRGAAGAHDSLYQASRAIAAARGVPAIVTALGEHLAGPDVERVSLWRVAEHPEDEDAERGSGTLGLAPLAAWERGSAGAQPHVPPAGERWMPFPPGFGPATPVRLQVDQLAPPERERWERRGTGSVLLAPLVTADGVWTAALMVESWAEEGLRRATMRSYLTAAAQAGVALENLRLLEQIREAAVVEERARLARDLHDSVTQSIFSLGMLARAAQTQHARGHPGLATSLEKIGSLAGEALSEMRALLVELRPSALATGGLTPAIEQLVASFRARTDMSVICAGAASVRLAQDAETAIFRIVQEALGNAVKHAEATEVCVTLADTPARLTVTVADNGKGFDPAMPVVPSEDGRRGGMGLRSMRERATAAGLVLDVASEPGAGTVVTLSAPAALFRDSP